MLYVAYGSNMNIRQMARRCPEADPIEAVTLVGWRLVMRGAADIERDRRSDTPAALWRLTPRCLAALDVYEGFPHLYVRAQIQANRQDGSRVSAMVYLMRGRMRRPHRPGTRPYVKSIIEGYEDFEIDDTGPVIRAQRAAMRTWADDLVATALASVGNRKE